MTRPDRTRLDDPTAEDTSDTSTQSASGIATPGVRYPAERNQIPTEEIVPRTSEERDHTPRRYEQPAEDDPVMPPEDSSLDTKI
jgi:hypothetical protein